MERNSSSDIVIVELLLANLLFSVASIFTKIASFKIIGSIEYFIYLGCTALVMLIYAILWQQILKRTDVTLANMFRGTSLLFTLLFSYLIFDECISIRNIVGAVIIVVGIILFVKL